MHGFVLREAFFDLERNVQNRIRQVQTGRPVHFDIDRIAVLDGGSAREVSASGSENGQGFQKGIGNGRDVQGSIALLLQGYIERERNGSIFGFFRFVCFLGFGGCCCCCCCLSQNMAGPIMKEIPIATTATATATIACTIAAITTTTRNNSSICFDPFLVVQRDRHSLSRKLDSTTTATANTVGFVVAAAAVVNIQVEGTDSGSLFLRHQRRRLLRRGRRRL
mmetsp:Transcript_25794/g.53863  ORF Transcript_25794/g.53863 Transcript_25794/m.53863 type:complete len:222 (-) Transcript_25794:1043-1708(-)